MALDPRQFMQTIADRVSFGDQEKSLLKSHSDWAKTIASEMANCFYSQLDRDPETQQILNASEGRIHRLHETFIQWFQEMFDGMDNWGDEYAKRRWRIGLVHVQVGIGPQHVVPAMATVVQAVGKQLNQEGKSTELQAALSKICMIDLAFIEQAYVEATANAVLKETGWTATLFDRLIKSGAAAM